MCAPLANRREELFLYLLWLSRKEREQKTERRSTFWIKEFNFFLKFCQLTDWMRRMYNVFTTNLVEYDAFVLRI